MFPSSPTSANLNDSSHKRTIDDLYGDLDIQEAYTPTFTTDDVANLVNKAKDIFTDFGSLFERTKKKHVTELAHMKMEWEFGFEYLKQEKEKTEKVLERITKEKDELELKNNTVNEEFIQKMDDAPSRDYLAFIGRMKTLQQVDLDRSRGQTGIIAI